MITRDSVTNLLLVMNRFMMKKGADMDSKLELISAIDDITGEKSLDAIYVNTTSNVMLPDVAVLHLYNDNFSTFIMDPDMPNTCPFGYTIEIHQRCFEKYTEEELTAVILHDILQNVQSDTAKIRLLKAWTIVMDKHDANMIVDIFDDINLSEVLYMAFTAVCLRPFRVPVVDTDYVATDEVLKIAGLAEAYDSYLTKVLGVSNDTVEDAMTRELNNDIRDINAIVDTCLDRTVQHYYYTIRCQVPLVSLERVMTKRQSLASVGFISRKHEYKPKNAPENTNAATEVIAESVVHLKAKSLYEYRFQIDKIINSMRYAETEAERDVVLFKIKELSMELAKEKKHLDDRVERRRANHSEYGKSADRVAVINEYLDELERLRDQTVHMEIKKKRWSVYIKDQLPEGYDF